MLNFSESVRGLTVGAPVDFRGIQIGEVKDIQLLFDAKQKKITVPVTISLDYRRIVLNGTKKAADVLYATHESRTDFFINKGLRAQLQTGNLITGQLFVALDFFPDADPFVMDWQEKVTEFPTMPGTVGELKNKITSILKKVDAMMNQVNQFSYKLNHTLEPELSGTLKQTTSTLVTIQDTLKNDSPVQQDLQATLNELTKAARSIKDLADYLERHPESLIQGKKGN